MSKTGVWMVLVASILVVSAASSQAAGDDLRLYATMGDSSLVVLDTESGEATMLHNIHLFCVTMCYDADAEVLYVITRGEPVLHALDPKSGASVEIGRVHVGSDEADHCEGLAFNPTDGQIYASVSLNGADTKSETFVILDPSDASCTIIGYFEGTIADEADALIFIGDQCYSIDSPGSGPANFYSVDWTVSPGESIRIIRYDDPLFENINDLAYDPGSDMLYGFDPNMPARLFTIDPLTGAATVVGETHEQGEFSGTSLTSLSFGPERSTGVNVRLQPLELFLSPNPCNPRVDIRLMLDRDAEVRVAVVDVRGGVVCDVYDGRLTAGRTNLSWDGCNDFGRAAPSGVYFALVRACGGMTMQRFTLVR